MGASLSSLLAPSEQRILPTSVRIGDLIYIFGGERDEPFRTKKYFHRNEVYIFNLRQQTWNYRIAGGEIPPPYYTRVSCAVINGFIFSAFVSHSGLVIHCLDPKEMKWALVHTNQPDSMEPSYCGFLWAFGSNLILSNKYHHHQLHFSGRLQGTWLEIKTTGRGPRALDCPAVAQIDEFRMLVSGRHSYQNLDEMFVFDFSKREWTNITFDHHPSPRNMHSLCRLKGRRLGGKKCFLLIGGKGDDITDHSYILDLDEQKAYKTEIFEPICGHASYCVENSDGIVEVISFFGKNPNTDVLKPVMTSVKLDNPEYRRIENQISCTSPSESQTAAPESESESESEWKQQCFDLKKQVAELESEKEEISELKERSEQQLSEKEVLLEESEKIRDELAARCHTLQGSLTESQKNLSEFLDIIVLNPNHVHLTDKKLGSGSFADVLVGRWHGIPVAVKKFHQLITTPRTSPLFQREVLVCSRLHHPNIITVCGAVMADGAPFQMVAELLEGSVSELMDAAHLSGCYLTVNEQLSIALETTSAIAYLHQLLPRPFVHSDIRSTNILVTRDMTVKVGDLGAAHLLESSMSVGPLSPPYLAPERMPLADGSSLRSSLEGDVYSLGVTLIEVFTGVAPIAEERMSQLRAMTGRGELFVMCSRMVEDNPVNRLSAQQCLASIERVRSCCEVSGVSTMKRFVVGEFVGDVHKVILNSKRLD